MQVLLTSQVLFQNLSMLHLGVFSAGTPHILSQYMVNPLALCFGTFLPALSALFYQLVDFGASATFQPVHFAGVTWR